MIFLYASGCRYGFGTYVASLCCGIRLGAAKNATVHSGAHAGEGIPRNPCSEMLRWTLLKALLAQPMPLPPAVRFRAACLSDVDIWGEGTLPSAMDLVLSTYKKPAVVLIDTWWAKPAESAASLALAHVSSSPMQ